jgi:dCMP deaminase
MQPDKFMPLADAVAKFSKDTSTQVGAVVIGPAGEIRSTGWNGAPRGCSADEDHRQERPEKYMWFSHSELNAITNAARVGTPLDGCSMIVTHPPCMDCARAIVQSGIKKVIWRAGDNAFNARWWEHRVRMLALFEECGVEFTEVPR